MEPYLFAAKQTPLTIFHVTSRDGTDEALRQAAEDHERQPPIERLA
jgi:hypothetical protein